MVEEVRYVCPWIPPTRAPVIVDMRKLVHAFLSLRFQWNNFIKNTVHFMVELVSLFERRHKFHFLREEIKLKYYFTEGQIRFILLNMYFESKSGPLVYKPNTNSWFVLSKIISLYRADCRRHTWL